MEPLQTWEVPRMRTIKNSPPQAHKIWLVRMFGQASLAAILIFLTHFAEAEVSYQQMCQFPLTEPNPEAPATILLEDTKGDFYGVSGRGGTKYNLADIAAYGTIFEVTKSGAFNVLFSF